METTEVADKFGGRGAPSLTLWFDAGTIQVRSV